MIVCIALIVNGSHWFYHSTSVSGTVAGFLMLSAGFIGFEIIRNKEKTKNRTEVYEIYGHLEHIARRLKDLYEKVYGEADDLS